MSSMMSQGAFATQADYLSAILRAEAESSDGHAAPDIGSLFDFQRPVPRRHPGAAEPQGRLQPTSDGAEGGEGGGGKKLRLSPLQNEALVALAGCSDVAQSGGKVAHEVGLGNKEHQCMVGEYMRQRAWVPPPRPEHS